MITGDSQTIEQIKYKSTTGTDVFYNHEDIIYCVMSSTSQNMLYAPSKLKVLNDTIQRIMKLNNFTDAYLESGGKDSVIVGYDDIMSDDMQREIKKEVDKFVKDSGKKTMLLNTEKLSVNSISGDITSTKVVEFLTDLNSQVLQSFKMPSFMIGDYKASTNADVIKSASRLFFETALKPLFSTLASHLTSYCRNVLGVKNILAEFDFEGISFLEDSAKERFEHSTGLYKLGLASLNEARVMNGLEPLDMEIADEYIAPSYIQSALPVRWSNYEEDISRNLGMTQSLEVSGEGGKDNDSSEKM